MSSKKHNSALILRKALLLISVVLISFFLSTPSYGQNTKGDKAETNGVRQNRFKGKTKRSKAQSYKTPSYRSKQPKRVTPNRSSPANAAVIKAKTRKPSASPKIYSQGDRYTNNNSRTPKDNQRAWRGTSSGSRLVKKNSASKTRNIYPQFSGRYSNNSARRPKDVQRPVSNRATLARLNKLQESSKGKPPGKKTKVVPRSASRSFIRHKTINANAGFWNVRKKGEQAITTDIAGKPLRTRNYQTPAREIIPPTLNPYYGRKRVGDKPYGGVSARGRISATPQSGQRAWRGDIAGRNIRGRNFTSKTRIEGQPSFVKSRWPRGRDRVFKGLFPGKGNKSATKPPEKRTGTIPLPVRTPGIGANRIGNFQGNIKGYRPLKGGGSRSGKTWNNEGIAIQGQQPGIGANRIGNFQGNIKGYRPLKGGGSRSGKTWNNEGLAIQGRQPGIGANKVGNFQGNIKTGRPVKGGGSVSGKTWNNQGNALGPKTPGIGADKIGTFQGNIKVSRPAKGGGSISGILWNNKEAAISVKTPPDRARKEALYKGSLKLFQESPGFTNQGEEFTGFIKLPKFKKGYVKNPNSVKETTLKHRPDKTSYQVEGLQIEVKRRDYVVNKNSSEEALKKLEPTAATIAVGNLQIKVKRRDYVVNKNASAEALKKLKPTAATEAVGNLQIKVKAYHYIHNNSSAKEALNVREPGKAFARATDYQGNIKMKKFDFDKLFSERNRELHPDAQFVKTNKNNVSEERDLFTNLKLWWGRNFRKSETQPDHLKEKERKPRYDKGEANMWND